MSDAICYQGYWNDWTDQPTLEDPGATIAVTLDSMYPNAGITASGGVEFSYYGATELLDSGESLSWFAFDPDDVAGTDEYYLWDNFSGYDVAYFPCHELHAARHVSTRRFLEAVDVTVYVGDITVTVDGVEMPVRVERDWCTRRITD